MLSPNFAQRTYAQRAEKFSNAAARQLLETMERKKSNLCVSVDVTKRSDFISVIDTVGPYVALIKVGVPTLVCGLGGSFTNQDTHRCTR
jgi:orotidine-5'-phosphate decarboxylase